MKLLTESAHLACKHELGKVTIDASQNLVTIRGERILVGKNAAKGVVQGDIEGKSIVGCPMYGPSIKPCTNTLVATEGYSELLFVRGRPICLDTITGITDGTPPGTVVYEVRDPGQSFVHTSH